MRAALAYDVALGAVNEMPDVSDPDAIPDDRLRLIFTCCHPAVPADSRVALTLKLVGDLTTAEIARAFLAPEPTIAQRLVRAKRTIRDGRLPYEVPENHLLPAARADFLRRLGRRSEAAAEYRRALGLADNARERTFLAARLAACEAGGPPRSS